MIQLYITAVLYFVSAYSLLAQSIKINKADIPKTRYYFDDFVDYRNKWQDHESPITKGYIKDGYYHYQNKQNSGSYLRFTYYNINPKADYYFDIEFKQESGDKDKANGLMFNHTSTKRNSNHQFLLTADQRYAIRKQVLGTYYDIVPLTRHSAIKENGNNKIGVLEKGDSLYYYINDICVHTMQRPPFIGNDIGFVIANQSTIAIDKLSIYYNPPAINSIVVDTNEYELEDAGSNINSLVDDISPVLSADGRTMFFLRAESQGDSKHTTTKVRYAEYDDKKKMWGGAKSLPGRLENDAEKVIYISPDKNMLIMNATYMAGIKVNDEGLSYTVRTSLGWEVPQTMPIKNYYNLDKYESFAVSANGKVLIISAHCADSYGQRDLYVSFRQSDGSWGEPKNLGNKINTYGHEDAPCLAPDNKTLYFNSDGLPGYGKTDLFVSHRLDDSWLNWTEPQNLGPHINTREGNSWIQVDADGNYAYTQVRDTFNYQIKRIVLPVAARAEPVVIVSGHVLDKNTGKPLSATLTYQNLQSGYEEGLANSSPDDGSFVAILPYGVNYGFSAKLKGYISESRLVDLSNDTLKKEIRQATVELSLVPIEKDKTVVLNNLFFDADRYELRESSFPELDRLVEIMNENSTLEIEIGGHTDKGGATVTKEYLQLLSQNRANAVRNYLLSKGVTASRVVAIGFGNAYPVSTNQQLNRRVEVRITKL